MVFERLVSVKNLEKKPWELFFFGIFWTSFGSALALFLFPEYASVISVTFTVILCLPFVYHSLSDEEDLYHNPVPELGLMKAHSHLFTCFTFLFLGILTSYFLWFVFAPPDWASLLFQAQASAISGANSGTGNFGVVSTWGLIFWHNTQILLVSALLAFFLGAGPIFLLAWNSSVIAAAMGSQAQSQLALIISSEGTLQWHEAAQAIFFPFYRYLLHGVPEIGAFIIGGLAGSLISIAVIRHKWGSHHFKRTMTDATILVVLSIAILFIAAGIEVWVLTTL